MYVTIDNIASMSCSGWFRVQIPERQIVKNDIAAIGALTHERRNIM